MCWTVARSSCSRSAHTRHTHACAAAVTSSRSRQRQLWLNTNTLFAAAVSAAHSASRICGGRQRAGQVTRRNPCAVCGGSTCMQATRMRAADAVASMHWLPPCSPQVPPSWRSGWLPMPRASRQSWPPGRPAGPHPHPAPSLPRAAGAGTAMQRGGRARTHCACCTRLHACDEVCMHALRMLRNVACCMGVLKHA